MSHESRARVAIERCRSLATYSEDSRGTRRTFLSSPMRDVHREIRRWIEPLGVDVRIDAAGNLRALYPGAERDAPRFLIGSHLDTVPNAGAFDGVLGVVLGVALLEALDGRRLPFALELAGFSEEEGVRFGAPFIGSRALVGRLDAELLVCEDTAGISVRRAIEDFGLDPRKIPAAQVADGELGFLEFHIEQGPVLEEMNRPLGVVEAIAGQTRMEFVFAGSANHAGTTPMSARHDALAGAAEWIGAVEREARRVPGLVATVGRVTSAPGAVNVICGEARAALDARHGSDEMRHAAVKALVNAASEIAARRGLTVRHSVMMDQPAVAMDAELTALAEDAVRRAGCEPHRMVSGAGHDAMILAEKIPATMIFLRTPGGVSHDPSETVRLEDVAKAIEAGMLLLEQLASRPVATQRRTKLA